MNNICQSAEERRVYQSGDLGAKKTLLLVDWQSLLKSLLDSPAESGEQRHLLDKM